MPISQQPNYNVRYLSLNKLRKQYTMWHSIKFLRSIQKTEIHWTTIYLVIVNYLVQAKNTQVS